MFERCQTTAPCSVHDHAASGSRRGPHSLWRAVDYPIQPRAVRSLRTRMSYDFTMCHAYITATLVDVRQRERSPFGLSTVAKFLDFVIKTTGPGLLLEGI